MARRPQERGAKIKIAVPMLSRIANFDDFDPLVAEPAVDLAFIAPGQAAARRCRSGDPAGIEGHPGRSRLSARPRLGHRSARPSSARRTGLGHLRRLSDAGTIGRRSRRHRRRSGQRSGFRIAGGRDGHGTARRPWSPSRASALGENGPWLRNAYGRDRRSRLRAAFLHAGRPARRRGLGRWQRDGRLSARAVRRRRFPPPLSRSARTGGAASDLAYETRVETILDTLAAHLETHLDLDRLLALSYIASKSRRSP